MSSPVDRWFREQDHPLEDAMQLARRFILEADPRVQESIKWKTPTFSFEGDIASFMRSKKVLSVMFHRGAEIPGNHPRLEGDARLVRTMRFADAKAVRAGKKDLQRAVRAWCRWRSS